MTKRGILIGIAGGSGSGKSSVAETLIHDLGSDRVVILRQDSYYRNIDAVRRPGEPIPNFDHPDALDLELLHEHCAELLEGRAIQQPLYDFSTHSRVGATPIAGPHHVIILEGTLVLYDEMLRALMDIKLFVDADADIRLLRRLRRDVAERGRTPESVITQYEQTVRPMHMTFVEPSKRHADVIIPEGGHNLVAIDLLKTKVRALLDQRAAEEAADEARRKSPSLFGVAEGTAAPSAVAR